MHRGKSPITLSAVQQLTRADLTDLRIIASRWEASVNELNQPLAPVGLGPRGQASVAAVRAAHTDVTAFAVRLAARVSVRASHVGEAGAHYRANETSSSNWLFTEVKRPIGI